MKISIRIKKLVLFALMGAMLLPVAHIYADSVQPTISSGLAAKMEQIDAELREKQPKTQDEFNALIENFLTSLTPEETEEFNQLQQAQASQQPTSQLSPALQEKIEKLGKEIFKDIDPQTITHEEYARLEEKLLSQLTPEERAEVEAVTKASQAINHKILSKVLEQLNGITRISQFLASTMNIGQVKPTDPKKALEYTQEISGITRQIQEQFSADEQSVTLDVIVKLVNLCTYLGNHLRYSIATNLNDIKPIAIEKVLQRSQDSNIHSPEDLEKAFDINDKLLTELDTQAQSIGLAWYQKGFRQLEALDTKYNLRWNALKLSVLSAIVAVTLHKSDSEFINSIPGIKWTGIDWIKKEYIGDQKTFDEFKRLVPGNYTQFSKYYYNITNRLGIFSDIIQPVVGLGGLYGFLLPDAIKWYAWSQEKLSNLATKLRGARAQYVFGGQEPKITFDDQIGQTHIKEQMKRYISYLLDPQSYDHRGIGIAHCNILFAGKSRTGKTYMAEAFAGELNRQLKARGKDPVKFFNISKIEIDYYGFKRILDIARENSPCIVFIDEIDMLGLQPDQNSALLQEFLTALSGVMGPSLSGVCFLAATNRPESLYTSLLKRFNETIWFDYPPYKDRKIAFKNDLEKHAIIVSPEFIDRIARESEGRSFEDLHKIIEVAAQYAENDHRAAAEADLQMAVDAIVWKIEHKPCSAALAQKQTMAAHLAGETLIRLLLPCDYEMAKVTLHDVAKQIKERPSYMRYFEKEASDESHEIGKILTYNSRNEKSINDELINNECKIKLAGHLSEKVLLGQSDYTYHAHNTSDALGLAKFIVLEGADLNQLPKEVKSQKTLAAYELVEKYKTEVETLLRQNKATLEALAQELMKRETLSRAEIETIIKRTTQSIPHASTAQRAE